MKNGRSDKSPVEVDFTRTTIGKALSIFFSNGCVLLRNCVNEHKLMRLKADVERLLTEEQRIHLYNTDMVKYGLAQLHEYVFEAKHYAILRAIFGHRYTVSGDTVTRRIDSGPGGDGWQPPLEPHLDAFFHPFEFTVNFWIPFHDCGREAPSLGVVRASFAQAMEFAGFDGNAPSAGGEYVWNLSNFRATPLAFGRLCEVFGDRIATPEYRIGDAMMLSNWTLHFTHSDPAMTNRRANVELRFLSDAGLQEIIARRDKGPLARRLAQFLGATRAARPSPF